MLASMMVSYLLSCDYSIYCDVLLTDGPMHTLLMQRHLGIERDFPCRVMSSVEEAADWVRNRIA
jgi:hypothetical protein